MYLNIGDQRVIVDAEFAEQDFVRDVEKKVSSLYRKLRLAFPARANREILAMVAYKYAWFYEDLKAKMNEAQTEVNECIKAIDTDLNSSEEPEDYFIAPDPEK